MITYLESEKLEEYIKDKKVVIDFYADWCMPCRMLGEIIEELTEEHKELSFVKVNVDKYPELAREYGVMSIPHIVLYKNNKIEKTHTGLMEKDELLDWIESSN